MYASLSARIVLLSLGVAALPVDKIVRREQVQLGATGEFVDVTKAKKTKDYCNWDFPLGEELSDECPEGSVKLKEKADCEQAAIQAGLKHIVVKEMTTYWQLRTPKGCFLEMCTEAADAGQTAAGGDGLGPCYRWNDVEPGPDNVTLGRPVCHRDRVKYGEVANDTIVCPDGYDTIKEEDLCLQDGKCMGDSDAAQSRINKYEADKYDDYPLYCFLDQPTTPVRSVLPGAAENTAATDQTTADDTTAGELLQGSPMKTKFPKVYFNAPLPNVDPIDDPPKRPAGVPFCNVTQITWFDQEGTLSPLQGCLRDIHNQCLSLPLSN